MQYSSLFGSQLSKFSLVRPARVYPVISDWHQHWQLLVLLVKLQQRSDFGSGWRGTPLPPKYRMEGKCAPRFQLVDRKKPRSLKLWTLQYCNKQPNWHQDFAYSRYKISEAYSDSESIVHRKSLYNPDILIKVPSRVLWWGFMFTRNLRVACCRKVGCHGTLSPRFETIMDHLPTTDPGLSGTGRLFPRDFMRLRYVLDWLGYLG